MRCRSGMYADGGAGSTVPVSDSKVIVPAVVEPRARELLGGDHAGVLAEDGHEERPEHLAVGGGARRVQVVDDRAGAIDRDARRTAFLEVAMEEARLQVAAPGARDPVQRAGGRLEEAPEALLPEREPIPAEPHAEELLERGEEPSDALACLGKLIACRQGQQREALKKRKEREKPAEESPLKAFVSPFGWIIAARRPASVLAGLAATPATGWPRGVYFSTGGMLRMGVVVASELPRERETLLVRLMAAGPLLRDAMLDLAALEGGALERAVAEQILIDLEHGLGKKSCPTPDEEEFIVSMQGTWSDARRIGRDEGRAEGEAAALLTVLRSRGISVPDSAGERIVAERDPARIERWIEKAAVATSLADVLDDPS